MSDLPLNFDCEYGASLSLDTLHTRTFNPIHIDGPPYYIQLSITNAQTTTSGEEQFVSISIDTAIKLSKTLHLLCEELNDKRDHNDNSDN